MERQGGVRLTRHLMAKDLRHMAPPAVCWVVLIAASALIVRCSAVPAQVVEGGNVNGWIGGLRMITDLLGVMEAVVSVLLTAFLVQEDPPTGSDATWLTRPIARGRLLAAKLAAAGLMLIVAPLVVLTVLWVSSGFSAGEVLRAGGDFVQGQAVIVVVAGSIAAITSDLGKFIFAALGLSLAGAAVAALRLTEWQLTVIPVEIVQTRATLVFWLALALAPTVGVVQYLTRRTSLAWGIIVLGYVAMVSIRLMWPWDTLAALPALSGRLETVAADSRGKAAVEKIVVPTDGNPVGTLFLKIGATGPKDEFVTPWGGAATFQWADERKIPVNCEIGRRWGEDAMKRLVGMAPNNGPVTWEMSARLRDGGSLTEAGAAPKMAGVWHFARVKARVVAELPWRAGAEARTGSIFTRVVRVGPLPASLVNGVVIEERDAWLGPVSGGGARSQMRETDAGRRDCFALVNRTLGIFKFLPIIEGGTLKRSALLLGERVLQYEPPQRMVDGKSVEIPDWQRDTVLVKVRFEVVDRWQSSVMADPVSLVMDEKKP